ncbi:MAG: response regulator [Cyanobacteria bacterium J06636_28]
MLTAIVLSLAGLIAMALLTKPTTKRLPCLLPYLPSHQPACRILVVDDHPVNRTLMMRLLQRSGFNVSQAVDGADAFTLWEKWQPQLIFMDLLMPEMDGREATRLIRTAETVNHQPPTKIIALTAHPAIANAHQAETGVFDDITTKPIRPYSIFELIAKHLDLQYVYSSLNSLDAVAVESH